MNVIKLLFNLNKIREYLGLLILILSKLKVILEFIGGELAGTPAGNAVLKYLPSVQAGLDKVLQVAAVIASFFGSLGGLVGNVVVSQTLQTPVPKTLEDAVNQLDTAVKLADDVLQD